MKKAWLTRACGIRAVVAAETRGKAKAITLASAFDANYPIKFKDVTAVRWPKGDGWAAEATHPGPLDPWEVP